MFVIAANRRLRYANPAWERATDHAFPPLRGMKLPLRNSPSTLSGTLAPPIEVWQGSAATVRRAAPGAEHGPPWWDLHFVPLLAEEAGKVLGVLATLQVTAAAEPPSQLVPAVLAAVQAQHAARYSVELLTGPSRSTQRLVSQVRAAATTRSPIWIHGEAGSGKATIARVIHQTAKPSGTFALLDCIGLQPYLIEGTLFGKGGLAGGRMVSTIALKNVEHLPQQLQRKIVNWIDTSHAPRLICLSSTQASEFVKTGQLLETFETNLSACEIRVPPLRERPEDIARIADSHDIHLSEEILAPFRVYSWPGNIRELLRVLHGMQRLADGKTLHKDYLPRYIRERYLIHSDPRPQAETPGLDAVLEQVERRMIQRALATAKGNQTEAAALLKIFRTRLGRRIEALGISPNT